MADRPAGSPVDRRRGADRGTPAESAQVAALLRPVVEADGLDLDDVEVRTAGRRRVVRVLVDGDGGVTLDRIAEVNRRVSDALDASDLLGEAPYTLEVSSRGVDRPLTEPRHWRRNVGRLVAVTLRGGAAFVGRIRASDDDGAELDVEGAPRRVPYAGVARAVVQVEFRDPADPADPADPVATDDAADTDSGSED